MGCYLCEFQRVEAPPTVAPIPSGTAAASRKPVGTCHNCGAWSCARHSTRYVMFECAICTPGLAVIQALTEDHDPAGDGPTVELMRLIGCDAKRNQLEFVERGLRRIDDDQRRARFEGFTSVDDDDLNVVTNLGVVMENAGAEDFVAGARPGGAAERSVGGGISVEAIAAAVRAQLGDRPLRVNSEATEVATGALLTAMALANGQPGSGMLKPEEVAFAPPWAVDRPALLDPIIWALATAIHL